MNFNTWSLKNLNYEKEIWNTKHKFKILNLNFKNSKISIQIEN